MFNNKGFTLVEVLAVIAILAIIMIIAIPSITTSIERSNDKKDKALEKLIRSEAELYVSKYKSSISVGVDKCYITVKALISEGNLNGTDIEGYEYSCLIYDGLEFEIMKKCDYGEIPSCK